MTTIDREPIRHQCMNASCGCNDGVTAGTCSTWCEANTTEASDVERGKDTLSVCECGHTTCADMRAAGVRGTPARGMA